MKQNKLIKAGVIFLVVVLVGTVYFFKNQSDENGVNEAYSFEVTSFDLEALKAQGMPIMLDFGSHDCGPCQVMAPDLIAVEELVRHQAIVTFADVWKYPAAANDYPISVIPSQIFYNQDGTPFVPSAQLAKEIEFTMYSTKDTNEHVFTIHQGILTKAQMLAIFGEMGVE